MSPQITKEKLQELIDNLPFPNIVELSKVLHVSPPDARKILRLNGMTLDDCDEDLVDMAEYSMYQLLQSEDPSTRLGASKFVLEKLKTKYKAEDNESQKLINALIANAESKKQ